MTESAPEPTQPPRKPDPILEYNNRIAAPLEQLRGAKVAMFIAGLFAGLTASGIAYAAAISAGGKSGLLTAIVLVIGGKIAASVHLLRTQPRWAPFAKGVLTSIGLIILLVGACFGLLANMKF